MAAGELQHVLLAAFIALMSSCGPAPAPASAIVLPSAAAHHFLVLVRSYYIHVFMKIRVTSCDHIILAMYSELMSGDLIAIAWHQHCAAIVYTITSAHAVVYFI